MFEKSTDCAGVKILGHLSTFSKKWEDPWNEVAKIAYS